MPLIEALAQRQAIAMDVYPYVAGSTVLREDLVDGVIDVMLTWSDAFPEVTGRMLADIAAEWGVDAEGRVPPPEARRRLLLPDATRTTCERVIAHPRTMIGSDGLPHDRHPHPRLWGAFPRVLARYWREQQAVLARAGGAQDDRAVGAQLPHRTSAACCAPARCADIVVFDPQRIADTATYDDPVSASVGVDAVYVNGRRAYGHDDGTVVRAREGRLLRRAASPGSSPG